MDGQARVGARPLSCRHQADRCSEDLLAKAFALISRATAINQPNHDSEQERDAVAQSNPNLQEAK